MSSMRCDPPHLRLDPMSYGELRQPGAASRWLAVSILRHHVEPGGPPQTVSEPLQSRLRGELDHAVRGMPRQCSLAEKQN